VRYRWEEIYDSIGVRVRDLVTAHFDTGASILDVGAGQGKYRLLLSAYPHVDGCEIHEQTIRTENLKDVYRHLFVGDVCTLLTNLAGEFTHGAPTYDLIIFGDVLEHIAVERAQIALRDALTIAGDVLVIVPYLYPQEPHDDNEHQRHLQEDLTPEVMCSRYPELRLVMLESRGSEPFKGIYRRR
jgi:SAM-dependent methyltransferase